MSKNNGQAFASLVGVAESSYQTVLTIDDDLQHPPELIPKLIRQLQEGQSAVYGIPSSRAEQNMRNRIATLLRGALALITGSPNWRIQSSFRIFSIPDGSDKNAFEKQLSIDFLIHELAGQAAPFSYESGKLKEEPRSRYRISGLLRHAWRQIRGSSSFSSLLFFASSALSILVALTSILALVAFVFLGSDPINSFLAVKLSLIVAFAFGALGRKSQKHVYRKAKPLNYEIAARTVSTVPS